MTIHKYIVMDTNAMGKSGVQKVTGEKKDTTTSTLMKMSIPDKYPFCNRHLLSLNSTHNMNNYAPNCNR